MRYHISYIYLKKYILFHHFSYSSCTCFRAPLSSLLIEIYSCMKKAPLFHISWRVSASYFEFEVIAFQLYYMIIAMPLIGKETAI